MFNIGPLELMVILIVALLVVGPTKLPEVGRAIGRGLREFRRAQDEVQRTLRLSLDEDEEPASRPMRAASTQATDEGHAADGEAPASARGDAEDEPEPAEVEDVAKALGRGLAELRRAKEELQSSFRVDLDDDDRRGRSAGP